MEREMALNQRRTVFKLGPKLLDYVEVQETYTNDLQLKHFLIMPTVQVAMIWLIALFGSPILVV